MLLLFVVRVVSHGNLRAYWERHAQSQKALRHWYAVVSGAEWTTPQDALQSFSKAKVLSRDRVRFEIEGGNFRLIAAFNFRRQVAFVKFVGTHAEYDRIDALTVSMF
jgi:mRNA interferase HigB